MDETYQDYVNRVARLTVPDNYHNQLQNIQPSPKFEKGRAEPFPGYTVITPQSEDDAENATFYRHLATYQQELLQKLGSELTIALPPASFHLTLADLIWDGTYREAIEENREFESKLQNKIAEIFQKYGNSVDRSDRISWQLLGLTVRPRAIIVCLVPKDEASYDRILQLRRYIYQNSDLIALGIAQQYDYTAHITLGYFRELPKDLDRDRLLQTLKEFNDRYIESEPQILKVTRAELRKFDNMMDYYRAENWPVLEF